MTALAAPASTLPADHAALPAIAPVTTVATIQNRFMIVSDPVLK